MLELRVPSGGGAANQKSTVSLSSVSHIVQMFPENSNSFLGKVPTEAVLTLYPCSPIHVSVSQCGHVLAQAWLMNRVGYSWGFVFETICRAHDGGISFGTSSEFSHTCFLWCLSWSPQVGGKYFCIYTSGHCSRSFCDLGIVCGGKIQGPVLK